jgi:3-methyladenine DNA glycosylase/8-oxoguanine DNA glycosylase
MHQTRAMSCLTRSAVVPAERIWRPTWPCPVDAILSPLRRGAGDPTFQRDPSGVVWRACRTPDGPVSVQICSVTGAGEVRATAWGSGSTWALDRLPTLLGATDDPRGFDPAHPVLRWAWRRYHHLRTPSTGLVFEALVPSIIEQKVTGREAWTGWRNLLRRFGEPAPGPGEARGLRVLPRPEAIALIPSWEWLRMQIDPGRSRTVVRAARVADALERTVGLPVDEVDRRLRSLPGVGLWSSAEVRQRAHGDSDAVSFGDYHLATLVGQTMTGEPVDDEEMASLLEPYRPHRHRVQRLVELAGSSPPRRGPRMAPRTHLPG